MHKRYLSLEGNYKRLDLKPKHEYMRLLLIMLFFVSSLLGQQQHNEVFGKWKVVKVETNNDVLTPTMDFFLIIGENTFHFNRDVNGCSAKPVLTETTIEFDSELCTRICCDGERDPIGGMNLYSGSYIVTEKTLVISNEKVKTYLEKISNER